MHLLYPSNPFDKKKADEDYEEEFAAAQNAGLAEARDHVVPQLVHDIASRIASPSFSVDIVLNSAGQPRLIELGDGQVSDKKKWPAERFVEMLGGPAMHAH